MKKKAINFLVMLLISIILTSCASIFYKNIAPLQGNEPKLIVGKIRTIPFVLDCLSYWGLIYDFKTGAIYKPDKNLSKELVQNVSSVKSSLSKDQAFDILKAKIEDVDISEIDYFGINFGANFVHVGGTGRVSIITKTHKICELSFKNVKTILITKNIITFSTFNHIDCDDSTFGYTFLLKEPKSDLNRFIASLLTFCPNVKTILVPNKLYYYSLTPQKKIDENREAL